MKIIITLYLSLLFSSQIFAASTINAREALNLLNVKLSVDGLSLKHITGIYSRMEKSDFTAEFMQWYDSQSKYSLLDMEIVPLKLKTEIWPGLPKYILTKSMVMAGGGNSSFLFPPRGVNIFIINFDLEDGFLAIPLRKWDSIIAIAETSQHPSIDLKYALDPADVRSLIELLKQAMNLNSH